MTLPRPSFIGLDPVAVCASHDALVALNLGPDRFNRFELMNVRGLALHVVNIQSRVMGAVATVNASGARLEVCKPLLYELAILVGRQIHTLPIPRLLKSAFAPSLALFGGGLRALRACAVRAEGGAVFGAIPLGGERLVANNAGSLKGGRVFPGRHNSMIPDIDVFYPCKPDIFEDTYEAVSEPPSFSTEGENHG